MSKKILIVDDDKDILEPLSLLLQDVGFVTDVTSKGQQTFIKVAQFKPDLILLDVLMSGSDGRVICKTLKSDPDTKDITVVLMSAHPGAEKDCRICAADGFIAKPFETDEMIGMVKKLLKVH